MHKSQKTILLVFLLLLVGLVYLEATKPQPVNWFPSYDKADKIPLGTFVLHKLMVTSFYEHFEETNQPPFEILKKQSLQGNYLFINNDIEFDKTELDSLLTWTAKGNTLFISANYFGENLLDTLQLKMKTVVNTSGIVTEPLIQLANKSLSDKTFHIEKDLEVRYFSKIDTLSQTVLGFSGIYGDALKTETSHINFIKAPLEKGTIFLHSQPEVFSNYFLLTKSNAEYTSALLSYINTGETVYWDNYYKSGKHINISPLRVLLNNKYFKWAYYFVLFGILLFIVFEGKRKQRSIPIVTPLTNKSYEYTKTIAGMYLENKEYHPIAQKQILLFLEYIRTKLRLPTDKMNERFYKAVAARSGNTLEDTQELFTFIEKLNSQDYIEQEDVLKLHQKIHRFKNISNEESAKIKSK